MGDKKSIINWKLFGLLLVMSVLSVAAVMPYTLNLARDKIAQLPISFNTFIVTQSIQAIFVMGISIFLGLLLARKNGFGVPLFSALVEHRTPPKQSGKRLLTSAAIGFVLGFLLLGIDYLFMQAGISINAEVPSIPWWQRLLASFYGGIGEEIPMRLLLVGLLSWIGGKVWKTPEGTVPAPVVWTAIASVAVVFGLGHLGITSALTELTPGIIARAIVLNGVVGIAFGWFFWQWGLAFAMLSHFAVDIAIHVVIPALQISTAYGG